MNALLLHKMLIVCKVLAYLDRVVGYRTIIVVIAVALLQVRVSQCMYVHHVGVGVCQCVCLSEVIGIPS